MLQWVVAILAILALIVLLKSDTFTSKSKHSSYYTNVQKPSGKKQRTANIPQSSESDNFYSKLNTNSKSH